MSSKVSRDKLFHQFLDYVFSENREKALTIKCQEPHFELFIKWLELEGLLCRKP